MTVVSLIIYYHCRCKKDKRHDKNIEGMRGSCEKAIYYSLGRNASLVATITARFPAFVTIEHYYKCT